MKKNVYSLVLSEDVVAAADVAAYRQGMSRSAFINRVLAEYLSYTTPEMQMREIFESMTAILDRSAILAADRSERMLLLRSALSYKYNPTVRYSLSLTGGRDPLGELCVSFRTQNRGLLEIIPSFYRIYCAAEVAILGRSDSYISEGKWVRPLRLRSSSSLSAAALGEAIAAYIRCFDAALKQYFRYFEHPALAVRAVEEVLHEYLRAAGETL